MSFDHFVYDGLVLALFRSEYCVRQVISDYFLVGWNNHNVHVVYFAEFIFFRLGCTGHAGQLVVHPEIVLQGDCSQGLGLGADAYVFLSLDGLVKSVAVASSEHETSGEFVYDYYFSVLYDVVYVSLHESVSF